MSVEQVMSKSDIIDMSQCVSIQQVLSDPLQNVQYVTIIDNAPTTQTTCPISMGEINPNIMTTMTVPQGEPVLAADSIAMTLPHDSSVTVPYLSIQQNGTLVMDAALISTDNQSANHTKWITTKKNPAAAGCASTTPTTSPFSMGMVTPNIMAMPRVNQCWQRTQSKWLYRMTPLSP